MAQKMIPFSKFNGLFFAPLFTLLVALLVSAQLSGDYFKLNHQVDIFSDILKELDEGYIDEVDFDLLVKEGIKGMFASLDPYTNFLSAEDLESFKIFTLGTYGGIGAVIGENHGQYIVQILYKGAAAQRAGMRVGDEIVRINGEKMKGQDLAHVVSLLKGMPETSVQLVVQRCGEQHPLELTVTREEVMLKNIPYYGLLEEDIGYVRLANFSYHASDELRNALETLKEQGSKRLVLDLRGNPGGVLEEAIKVTNLFIKQHMTVVATRGRVQGLERTYSTPAPAYDEKTPLVVLIDEASASAAEIVAGVLQDYDRGVLLGKRTYGKGLVQVTRPLSHNTQLKLTAFKYYIPSGRSIQKVDYSQQRVRKKKKNADKETKKAFKTKGGRVVYDGMGIAPDIEGKSLKLAPITLSLIERGLIFDYMAVFQARHKQIRPAKNFMLSDVQYKHFVSWLKDKEYPYSIEPMVDRLLHQIEKEGYMEDLKRPILGIKKQLRRRQSEDLQRFKSEIKLVLQEAIVMAYHFQEGAIEAMLPHDKIVEQARSILNDQNAYEAILGAGK